MMLLLQSSDHFTEMMKLDPVSGEAHFVSRGDVAEPHRISGAYARVGEHLACLYRCGDRLFFSLDGKRTEVSEDAAAHLRRRGEARVLTIRQGNLTLVEWEYRLPPVNPPLEEDPTPFVDAEDFDFGLFVSNVLNDGARKDRIFR